MGVTENELIGKLKGLRLSASDALKIVQNLEHATDGLALIKFGAGAPSGTPDALFYVNCTSAVHATTLYSGGSGSWTAFG